NGSGSRRSFHANNEPAIQSAIERRTVLRRIWPVESNASTYLGLRRHAYRERLISRARRVARRRRANFLDVASTVVFPVNLCVAKWTRQHRIFVPESRRRRNVLRPHNDRS